MSNLSPLKADHICLERLEIVLTPEYENDGPEDYKVDVKVDVKKHENALAWRIRLAVKLTPAPEFTCRYGKIAITTMGQFQLPDDTPGELVHQIVPFNCVAMLHGFSRGVVAQVTGLNEGGAFLLPVVNFFEVLKAQGAKRKPASKAGTKDGNEADPK
jgi:preprotein translocase subunit SecB